MSLHDDLHHYDLMSANDATLFQLSLSNRKNSCVS